MKGGNGGRKVWPWLWLPLGLAVALVAPRLARAQEAGELAPVISTGCTATKTTLCLLNNEFAVTATFMTPDGTTGHAQAQSITADTGYFWFFSSANVEFVIKAIDGCAVNDQFWIFAGGLTNVKVDIAVTFVPSGATKHYVNPLNFAFRPIQDTSFAFCAISSARFKEDIADMGDAGESLMKLRPGVFSVGSALGGGAHLVPYGLVAEDVAKIYPGLMQYDKQGKPLAVSYHFIDALLLAELQKQRRSADRQGGEIEELRRRIAAVAERLRALSGPPS